MWKRFNTSLDGSFREAVRKDPRLLNSEGFRLLNRVVPELISLHAETISGLPFNLERVLGHVSRIEPDQFASVMRNAVMQMNSIADITRAQVTFGYLANELQITVTAYAKDSIVLWAWRLSSTPEGELRRSSIMSR